MLDEGFIPDGGSFYLALRKEIKNWACLNLFGDELYASNILLEVFFQSFEGLVEDKNRSPFFILEKLSQGKYFIGYDL